MIWLKVMTYDIASYDVPRENKIYQYGNILNWDIYLNQGIS